MTRYCPWNGWSALAEQLVHRIVYDRAHLDNWGRWTCHCVAVADGPSDAEPGQEEKSPGGVCVHVEVEAIVYLAMLPRKIFRERDLLVTREAGKRGIDISETAKLAAH